MSARIIVGITGNGERLRFERWVVEAYERDTITDAFLLAQLNRVRVFTSKEYERTRAWQNSKDVPTNYMRGCKPREER